MLCKSFVQPHKTGRRHLRRREPRKEALGKTPIAVVEGKEIGRCGICQERRSGIALDLG